MSTCDSLHVKLIKTNLDNLGVYKKSWDKLEGEMKTTINYIYLEQNKCFSRPGLTVSLITSINNLWDMKIHPGWIVFVG